ncbi:OFA family MFS transporter [Clostridium beijerinckii]|uniref:OFA family MFS transporter n=1 Tax=Clostridium beijerinckii TaxID=1520 RepID=UPI00156D7319|nr:OFA family MFS transporter [Clostridium beijerinckii]NRU52624.1 OFA family oxalate/formate antiporter-like MFS transporter [Clostridium beijerinckii]NYC68667.1 OFA family oxalate/formate antiporter-like MFS transporter [Clostridium beijerinckii]NYC91816.1 OFA family oxalate/formate antiporter-like MFS transporter [Clostridium beijerinckii]
MKLNQNKWINGAIPALLIHCSIGTVYCWSLLKGNIANYIGQSVNSVEWAFSIAIFFLGMSASFGGKFVEKDIHKSSLLATILFTLGMFGTGLSIYFKSLIGIYISYGVIMGIGLGIGYLTPVKTLMIWFKENKGLATGIAVMGFGLAKVIASPIMQYLQQITTIYNMFYILGGMYFISMFIGHLLLKKPKKYQDNDTYIPINKLSIIKNKTFIGIWIMFYINITCGLALIAQEKDIYTYMGFTAIAFASSLSAIFNAGGRLVFSSIGDKLKDRNTIYKLIFGLSIGFILATILTNAISNSIIILVIILLCVVNAGYGGGFSNLPTLLSDRYGMQNISTIHGLELSAWAIAGITGNQLSAYIISKTHNYNDVLYILLILYTIAMIISFVLVKPNTKYDK